MSGRTGRSTRPARSPSGGLRQRDLAGGRFPLTDAPYQRKSFKRTIPVSRKAEAAQANSTARIEPFARDKGLILSLLSALFRAVFLQRSVERTTPHRLGSSRRSIINAFGGDLP
jgi:hypothetical protein